MPKRRPTQTRRAYKICPTCGVRIDLVARKDFESYSDVEYQEHYATAHADLRKPGQIGIPYASTKFEVVK